MERLRRLVGLSWPERLLLVEAVVGLAIARIAVVTLPFRWIAPCLGETGCETSEDEPDAARAELAGRVGRAIRRIQPVTPWDSNCLAQAVTAQCMLRRRGIPATVYLGAVLSGTRKLQAHAWVRCGRSFLTGGGGAERYAVVTSFAPVHQTRRGRLRPAGLS
jgi:hypothetical protein